MHWKNCLNVFLYDLGACLCWASVHIHCQNELKFRDPGKKNKNRELVTEQTTLMPQGVFRYRFSTHTVGNSSVVSKQRHSTFSFGQRLSADESQAWKKGEVLGYTKKGKGLWVSFGLGFGPKGLSNTGPKVISFLISEKRQTGIHLTAL